MRLNSNFYLKSSSIVFLTLLIVWLISFITDRSVVSEIVLGLIFLLLLVMSLVSLARLYKNQNSQMVMEKTYSTNNQGESIAVSIPKKTILFIANIVYVSAFFLIFGAEVPSTENYLRYILAVFVLLLTNIALYIYTTDKND